MNEKFRILVIEDDADTRATLFDILELEGYDVVTTSSFAEALRVAGEQAFGIILSDRRLTDGLIEDFLPAINAVVNGAEIIVVTGYGDVQSTIAAFRQGVTDYVIKPVIPEDLIGTVQRIFETQRLEQELKEEHAFADQVLNTAEAIVLVLALDGTVIRFNPYFQQLTGWSRDELVGRDWFNLCIAEQDQERVREVFIRTARDERTRGIINDTLGKDGRAHQVRWSNTTLKDASGVVTAVLAVGVDVSDLAQAQGRALQAERLAAIGQTVTALAHESRNAMQRIQAAAEVLALELQDYPEAKRDLQAIQRANNDLKGLLEQVRSFAAPIQMHPKPICLSDVWRRAWGDLLTIRRGRKVELIEVIEACDLEVEVDIVRMEQVFRNLFENSLAACPDPVRIEVTCQCADDAIEIRCSDNGPGLTSDQQAKLFEPFFTTKPTGTGLGMSICQRIVDAHGGTITTDPDHRGACIVIRLPRRVSNHVFVRL